ncbi:MAG: RNA polymerase sigma factor [Acidobacteriota bacterium]
MTGFAASMPPTEAELQAMRRELVRAVRRLCPRSLADDSEDLVQNALLRVVDAVGRRETTETLRASYLWRAAHSAVVDELRRRQRRPEHELDPERPDPASASPGPERRASDRQAGVALRACVEALLPDRRRAVSFHLLGHRIAQVAELTGWNQKRAKNLIYRGLADVRRCMAEKGFDRGETT